MTQDNTPFDLNRFVEAQKSDYHTALRELKYGKKVSHWIWYIFPQLAELGCSYRAKYYGLDGLEEARAYMDHPVLGPRYLISVETLPQHQDRPIVEVMGGEVDAKKLQSSLTLMLTASGSEAVETALIAFYGGSKCHETRQLVDHDF